MYKLICMFVNDNYWIGTTFRAACRLQNHNKVPILELLVIEIYILISLNIRLLLF